MDGTGLMAQATDTQLIQACLGGDGRAWESLLERYERLIYSIPRRYGMSEADAAEVFQNVCIALLEQLSRLRDHARLGAWLVTTTRRECWRQWRQRDSAEPLSQNGPIVPAQASDAPPEDVVAEYEEYTRVRLAVERLAEGCRDLLWLLYYDQEQPSYQDIAARLHISVGSIGPTRARCLAKLRVALTEGSA
jgi:RNA polymerase sigma factor (sigma-70 family)